MLIVVLTAYLIAELLETLHPSRGRPMFLLPLTANLIAELLEMPVVQEPSEVRAAASVERLNN
jgi:hypothetical protein